MARTVRVWDLPTRIFHWLLVVLLGFSWWSAENHEMDWHRLSGLILVGLIVFRLIWGFIGGSTARFSRFVRGPSTIIAQMRGRGDGVKRPGHNPLGGYSVLAMLAVLTAQLASGLFAIDVDGLESGYLSHLVSFEQGRAAAEFHEAAFALLRGLVLLHLAAIVFYFVARKRNLVRPMITGEDPVFDTDEHALRPASPARLALAAIFAAATAWWISRGMPIG